MYIEMSTARVKSFRRSHMTSLSPNEGLIRPKLSKQDFSYLVQVGIGTFMDEFPTSKTYYLYLDTGSQLTWTQCEGCIHCFEQVDPPFPASQSATYLPLSCKYCPPDTICQDGKCVISIDYSDGSKVSAILAMEDFTFASQGESSHKIDVIFGCGFDMQKFDEGTATSWIVTGAFDVVKDAVITFIKDHNNDNWRKMRTPPPDMHYKLCYQRYKLPKTINLPKITFHFENNADFEIDTQESFYHGKSSKGKDMVCMQFLESTFDGGDGVTYLGGVQQANKRIVYDLENSLLHFGPADCSNEN
ncbi:aspartyl protease family protein At5g10770-like [Silene latifolia]|uniref:aspartyl protease family protein At5g10770-like n=1 Tax=Silene latifolia TaxID=37657 RepID=UPI003D778653